MAQTHTPSVPSLATGLPSRHLALTGALVLGVALALLTIPEFGPWMHAQQGHHHRQVALR
jgi:hypothetical protein